MDSVLLWKEEPLSPLYNGEAFDEDTLYQTTFDENIKYETELICESKAEAASQILEDLENLMDLDDLIKEEQFLLDEKMLPLLDEVQPPQAVPVHPIKREYFKSPDTQSLLKEFLESTVYDFNPGALTPPQSPPNVFTTLEPAIYSVPEKPTYRDAFHMDFPATPQPDIAHELAVVDEFVRTCAENMQLSSEPASPLSSSSSSNFGDCSSSEDPEWSPEIAENSNDVTLKARKRSKSGRGSTDDKKSRKKEQNKNAATRYRMKKKAEVEVILTEEKIMLQHNTELGTKITDLQREVKYLKGLMRDLFKAKGLIH